jgi:hypothetical protein
MVGHAILAPSATRSRPTLATAARPRDLRPLWLGLTGLALILLAVETAALYLIIDNENAIGTDLHYYRSVAERWLTTGVWFTADQLAGPFVVETQVTNLYPPHALYLFVPFVNLPAVLWWAIPLAVIGYVIWWCRPVVWAWPLIALILVFPKTPAQILFGNTDMWIAAFIAGGVRWAWPAVFVTIKPSLAFFALIGIRSRVWWLVAAILAIVSLPFIGLWLDWITVTRNSSAQWYYSFGNLPFFLLPIVAWLVSSRRGDVPVATWAAGLLRGGGATVRGLASR